MDIFYTRIKEEKNRTKYEIQHYTGRMLLNYVAKEIYGIKNSEIEIINKKPKFKYSNKKFNISHSDEIVAICFDDFNVGFDIEKMKNRNFEKISKRMNFAIKKYDKETFYKEWTLFEAEYKLQNKSNSTYSTVINDEYAISVASEVTTDIEKIIKIQELSNKVIFLK